MLFYYNGETPTDMKIQRLERELAEVVKINSEQKAKYYKECEELRAENNQNKELFEIAHNNNAENAKARRGLEARLNAINKDLVIDTEDKREDWVGKPVNNKTISIYSKWLLDKHFQTNTAEQSGVHTIPKEAKQ